MTPAVAIAGAGAVDWGPLHVPLPSVLTMAAMSLRLGRIDAQVVYTHGSSSHPYQLHSSTPHHLSHCSQIVSPDKR